jgi:hypothetical protein
MRWDKENQLCAAQAFTGAATVSENSYQKQSAAQDISIGRRMALLCIVTTAAGAGSTHDMDCVQADNTALTTNLAVVASVDGILAATLVAGYVFEIPHIGFQNTSTGGTTTVSLDVYLVPQDEIPKYKSFPRGSNIASV